MDLSGGSAEQQGLSATGSGRILSLHTARKRSKPSLVSCFGAGSDTGTAGSTAYYIQSQPVDSMMTGEGRGSRTPIVTAGANGKAVGWQVAGYPIDYALDWALVVVLGVILAASEAGIPREGYMRKADLTHTAYPLLPNSVPAWAVPLYTVVLPAMMFGLHCFMLRRPFVESHHLVLGVLTSVLFTAALTNIIKCPVGRLRPDFNARCWPDGKVTWQKEDEMGGYPLCTGPASVVAEGRKSFPSGHSSWSSSGLCFITWWLLDRLRVFDGSGHPWRLAAAILPALAALAVGVSRYVDYWHHASDVAAGLLLGAAVSWVCYRQQRARLTDIDPATYACGNSNGWPGGVGGGPGGSSSSRGEEDGTPLLYTSGHFDPPPHQQQQQQQQQQLPV